MFDYNGKFWKTTIHLLQQEGGRVVTPGTVEETLAHVSKAVGPDSALPGGQGQRHPLLGLLELPPHLQEPRVTHRPELVEEVRHGRVLVPGARSCGEGVPGRRVLQHAGRLEAARPRPRLAARARGLGDGDVLDWDGDAAGRVRAGHRLPLRLDVEGRGLGGGAVVEAEAGGGGARRGVEQRLQGRVDVAVCGAGARLGQGVGVAGGRGGLVAGAVGEGGRGRALGEDGLHGAVHAVLAVTGEHPALAPPRPRPRAARQHRTAQRRGPAVTQRRGGRGRLRGGRADRRGRAVGRAQPPHQRGGDGVAGGLLGAVRGHEAGHEVLQVPVEVGRGEELQRVLGLACASLGRVEVGDGAAAAGRVPGGGGWRGHGAAAAAGRGRVRGEVQLPVSGAGPAVVVAAVGAGRVAVARLPRVVARLLEAAAVGLLLLLAAPLPLRAPLRRRGE